MSVEVETESVTLTWDNNSLTWDSLGDYTWDSCDLIGTFLTVTYDLELTESLTKNADHTKIIEENLTLKDTISKGFNLAFNEYLKLQPNLLQNSSSVIYDVSLRSAGGLGLNDIRTLARQFQVAGYEQGVEFLPGDYDFKEAIVGLVLTNNTTQKVGFKEIDVYTDTPDIMDRGEIEITNSGTNYNPLDGYTTVYLNKKYHNIPNITATAVSGTAVATCVFDPNGYYRDPDTSIIRFRVKLTKSVTGNYINNTTLVLGGGTTTPVTGVLLWKAVGY